MDRSCEKCMHFSSLNIIKWKIRKVKNIISLASNRVFYILPRMGEANALAYCLYKPLT